MFQSLSHRRTESGVCLRKMAHLGKPVANAKLNALFCDNCSPSSEETASSKAEPSVPNDNAVNGYPFFLVPQAMLHHGNQCSAHASKSIAPFLFEPVRLTVHWSCPFQCWPSGTLNPWGQAETMAQFLGGVVRPCATPGIWLAAMMHLWPFLEKLLQCPAQAGI